MKSLRKKTGFVLAATCALGVSTSAYADDDVNIMFIGDSITWGMTWSNNQNQPSSTQQSNGGFRTPLFNGTGTFEGINQRAALSGYNYKAVGHKGDGVVTTFADNSVEYVGQTSAFYFPDANGDGIDAPGDNNSDPTRFHDGYSAWVIDAGAYGTGLTREEQVASGQASLAAGNRGGIRQIISDVGDNNVNPMDAVTAGGKSQGVIMLMIGVNDISPFVKDGINSTSNSPYNNLGEIVDQLDLLIDDIVSLADENTTVVVSTVLPVFTNRVSFSSTVFNDDPMNTAIDDFNDDLRERIFGATDWQDDSLGTDTWAEHQEHDNVILVDANSAISRAYAANNTGDLHTTFDDHLHLTPQGYANLAEFYADRFEALQIIPEPSSAALLAVLGGLAMTRRRRSA